MANYATLKAAIADVIKTNGSNAITGALLQSSLMSMIDSLGAGYQFAGVAIPTTNPGTTDQKTFYVAGPGTYTNFGNAVVPGNSVGFFYGSGGSFSLNTIQTSPFSAETIVTGIIQLYDGDTPVYPITKGEAVFLNGDTDKKIENFSCPGGVNLFNLETRNKNKFLNSNNGLILDLANYYISDYIFVKGLTTVTFSGVVTSSPGWELFDGNKNRTSYGGGKTITIGDAVYLRVCGSEYGVSKDMVCAGAQPNVYVPFTNCDKHSLYAITNENFIKQTNPPILDELTIISTTYEAGIFGSSHTDYSTSDYIEVLDNAQKLYFLFQQTSGSVPKIKFYDKDKNEIGNVGWADLNPYVNKILELRPPMGCQYVRFAKYNSSQYDGIYTLPIKNPADSISKLLSAYYTETNNIVWVGTSIPEGATYPIRASQACGYNCINNSLGSQSLAIRIGDSLCMMYTQQEFYDNFHSAIGSTLTQAEYNRRIDKTFERNVIPFVKGESLVVNDGDGSRTINPNAIKISALVIDHNYNDYVNIAQLLADEQNIDWTSRDRTNFVGAMNYLMDEVRKHNPTLKIVLAGYFQNSWLIGGTADVCKMQSLCAEHFNLEIIETWKYSQINNKIIKGTSGYMAWFNSTYNKSYVVPASAQDAQGNITAQYIYLPDGIHPHSDLTQHCNERLNAIYTKLLRSII